VRKRLAIVGHSEEGLTLIPLLEANPDVEVCGILTDQPLQAMQVLRRTEPALAERFWDRITSDPSEILNTAGLTALIDADPLYGATYSPNNEFDMCLRVDNLDYGAEVAIVTPVYVVA